jgi:GH35 family endo-1,4-beta-xylanase
MCFKEGLIFLLVLNFTSTIGDVIVAQSDSINNDDWIKEANIRIEKFRKGDADVKLIFNDKVLVNYSVNYEMVRHLFPFGCCINFQKRRDITDEEDKIYKKLFIENFNSAVPENHMKWVHISKDLNNPDYLAGDEIVEFCKSNNIFLRGHCLTWESHYPDWVKVLNGEELKDGIKKHIQQAVKHFSGYIREWDVDNEFVHCDYVQKKLGERIVVDMHRFAEESDSKIRLFVNEYEEWNPDFRKRLIEKVKWLVKSGAKVDGIGLQSHFSKTIPGGIRNMKEYIEEIYEALKLPIKLTEFDIENPLSEEKYAEDIESFYRMAFSMPQVEGIFMWGFWEKRHWRPSAAIYRKDFSERLAAKAYRKLIFNEWWTKGNAKTDKNGEFKFRGFYGDYKIILTLPDGRTVTKVFKLTPEEKQITIYF